MRKDFVVISLPDEIHMPKLLRTDYQTKVPNWDSSRATCMIDDVKLCSVITPTRESESSNSESDSSEEDSSSYNSSYDESEISYEIDSPQTVETIQQDDITFNIRVNQKQRKTIRKIVRSKLKVGAFLENGGTAEVYEGRYDSQKVAIKCYFGFVEKNTIRNEMEVLNQFDHPNVVKFLGLYKKQQIVMEYCDAGSLFNVLHVNSQRTTRFCELSEELKLISKYKKKIAVGICKGMIHVHSKKVIHCDLSSKNILLDCNYSPKIADFGLSKTEGNEKGKRLGFGTTAWRAPEIFKTSKKNDQVIWFTEKIDVYSFGIILWELTHLGHLPWEGELEIFRRLKREKRPPLNCSSRWRKLIQKCWATNAAERPSFVSILQSLKSI